MNPIQIRNLRKTMGLTQTAFGERIGIKRSLIGAWEVGASAPSADVVLRLRRVQQEMLERRLNEGQPPSIRAAVEAIVFEGRVEAKVRIGIALANYGKVALQLLIGEMKPKELRDAGDLAAELVGQTDAALCGELGVYFDSLEDESRALLLRKFGSFPKMVKMIEERTLAEVMALATPKKPLRPWEVTPEEENARALG